MSNKKIRSKHKRTSDDEDTSGFVDINNYYNKAIDVKVKNIDDAIDSLKMTITKYMDDCLAMWDEEIMPFSKSRDCVILKNLTEKDCLQFLEFMKGQKPYKIMIVSLDRLEATKDYILRHSK